MIKTRIQVEEMHIYYFIAKKLISEAKLGILGITSGEEKLLKKIYSCSEIDVLDDLVKKISDRLDDKQEKLDRLVLNSNNTKQFITEAVNCVKDLKYKSEVLENVMKFLKPEFTTSQMVTLCIEKIAQAKRVLAGLSPEEKKAIISTARFDFKKSSNVHMKVTAVDAENISNKKTALLDNATGEKIAVSNVPIIDEKKGNIISNNIDKNIVKITDKKLSVEADIEVLERQEEVETLDSVEEVLDDNVSVGKQVVKKIEKVDVEEVLEIEDNNKTLDATNATLDECESVEKIDSEVNNDIDNRESIESSYVGVMADNFDVDPLDYYSVGSSIYDKDVLEYNIPTIEPAYEIIGNFKQTPFGDTFDKSVIADYDEDLEKSIPVIEEFSETVFSNNITQQANTNVEEKKDISTSQGVGDENSTKEKTVSYDEPVIFKIIESDGIPLE